jgi:HK97 family phage prohead protease
VPWSIDPDRPDCDGYAVVKDSDGSVAGCHDTLAGAHAQMAALYANEDDRGRGADSAGVEARRSGLVVPHGTTIPPLSRRDRRRLPDQVTRRLTEAYGDQALDVAHRGFDIDYRGKRLEHRACRRVELRQSEEFGPVGHGYATIYGERYDVWGGPPYGFNETIEPGAADKSVREQDEVYAFFDHEGLPLGATKAGTLTLASDRIGLFSEIKFDRASPYSMEIVSRLERGELDAMSFAFEVLRQEWSDDYLERRITEVRLFDVSIVSYPANPATVVGLRSGASREKRGMSLSMARAQMDALRARS